MPPFRPRLLSLPVLLCLAAFSTHSVASYDRMITDAELAVLPQWCMSAFLNSGYSDKVAPKKRSGGGRVQDSDRSGGTSSLHIPGGHHFCNGLVELNRGKKRPASYGLAVDEFNYSYSRMDVTYPYLSYVAAYLGKALYASGKRRQAAEVWTDAISAQPANRHAYLALTEALLGESRYDEALQVMLAYDKAKETESADAEQFLAQAYFKLNQYDQARVHAEKARQLGYPFTALLDKLNRMQDGK